MSQSTKTIFITGVAGFIGYFTALRLLKEGYRVVGIDNMNTYYAPELKALRREKLIEAGLEFHLGDIKDASVLKSIFHMQHFDTVIHLAAQAGVRHSTNNPIQFVEDNIYGLVNVLECVREYPCKLLFASSSSVYGKNKDFPYKESDSVDNPASFYAATKSAGELLAKSYHNLHGIAMYGLRFFTVYGPMGRPDMAYFSFAEKMMKGEPIEVFNYGNMERDFTYIDDIVEGIIAGVKAIKEGEFELFNLGGDHTYKIGDLIHHLEENLGKKAQVIMRPTPLGDVEKTCGDITKASIAFDYRPQIELKEGIEKFCAWYQSWIKAHAHHV
ncbi:protein CapI [Candidatus Aerophobetes bacterium]|uniref:Protein CapI n=1 Tax=Aerophobetes bacterium TaxID=2030807 RepID=A0A2A4X3X2_UNCAE|nr:MAG: protein CapI [Candidatus Aerophobetes bacterium]